VTDWQKDFSYFWESVRDGYAYWDRAPCNWSAVPRAYAADLAAVKDEIGFIRLLERVIAELCDNHASLGTNLDDSFRLVPSGTDVRVEARSNGIYITDLRYGSSELKRGDRILGIGGQPIHAALASVWPRTVPKGSLVAKTCCANVLLAGRHNQPRLVQTPRGKFELESAERGPAGPGLVRFDNQKPVSHIRPADSLGNNELIAEFDKYMPFLTGGEGLILDLTDTPGGGNTTVARAILGWFVNKEMPYQRHENPSELRQFGVRRFWTEWVAPRPGKFYGGPLCVLVNGWTGSMGEGIAIALQGMGRAKLVGMPMAGLLGAISRDETPVAKIPFFFPTERLSRLDGTPREKCLPDVMAPSAAFQRATTLLRSLPRPKTGLFVMDPNVPGTARGPVKN
jgi:hypothetical protein